MPNAVKLPDTNVILRYLRRDVPNQYKLAKALFDKVKAGTEKMFITEGVLIETMYILTKQYGVPRAVAAEQLDSLIYYKGVTNKNKAAMAWALRRHGESNKLDLVDCLLVARAYDKENVELVTFDKHARKLADHPDARIFWRTLRIAEMTAGKRKNATRKL